MKLRRPLLVLALLSAGLTVWCTDHFLLPEMFFMHKGQTLNLHLLTGDGFDNATPAKYIAARTSNFAIYEGGKKNGLQTFAKPDTAAIANYKLNVPGLALVTMQRSFADIVIDKAAFIDEIDNEGQTKIYDRVNISAQSKFSIRTVSFMKALLVVDKSEGNLFSKETGAELEIIPQQNPYMLNYGDDVTTLIKFKGKKVINAHIDVLIKPAMGTVSSQRLNSDIKGNIYVKLGREGIYLLRVVIIQPSNTGITDYEKWQATYTFAFSSSNVLPNSYKSFGIGNKRL